MASRAYNALFICTGNSARSILAEVILNNLGQARFRAFSAGSQPKGAVHPMALEVLHRAGYRADGLRSKSWDEFGAPDAPQMDFIFTVCDNAAGEACPFWPGHPVTAHWGFADPAAVTGTDEIKRRAFEKVFHEISARIRLFLALPFDKIDRLAIQNRLRAIGQTKVS